MNGAKYREVLDEPAPECAKLQTGVKHTDKTTQGWIWDMSLNVLEWPSQSLDFNPIEHLERREYSCAKDTPNPT